MLGLPIHEIGRALCLFSSLVSFNNVLSLSGDKLCVSFVKFIPKYYFFDAVVNGIIFDFCIQVVANV